MLKILHGQSYLKFIVSEWQFGRMTKCDATIDALRITIVLFNRCRRPVYPFDVRKEARERHSYESHLVSKSAPNINNGKAS